MNTAAAPRVDREIFDPATEPAPSRFSFDGIVDSLKGIASVSEAMRILGAGALLASMSLFLLQGWSEGNDISRYLLLLAQTGLLTVGGFAMSHGLKEAKGARVFFGLALISVPANFTILGALIYSVFQLDGSLTAYPDYATWQLGDIANLGLTMGGSLLLLLPVTLFCFAIMARHSAKGLTLHFAALNLLLLVPVRDSVIAGAIGLAATVYAVWVIQSLLAKDKALRTPEGRFALTALFIPIGILLFRSMYFYDISSLMIAMLGTALFIACRQAAAYPERSKLVAGLLDTVSLPVAMTVAITSTMAIEDLRFVPDELLAPLAALVYAAFSIDVMRRTTSGIVSGFASATTSLAVTLACMLSVVFTETALSALVGLIAGSVLLVAGLWFRERSAVIAGVLTQTVSVWFGFEPFMDLVLASSWISLAVIGASTIVMGSLLERHGVAVKHKLMRWTQGPRRREASVLDD